MAEERKVLGWPAIIGILVGTSLITGLVLGLLGEMFGLGGGARTAGVGAVTGVVAAFLIGRRRAGTLRDR